MFQLTDKQWENLKSQNATSSWGGRRTLPYAFTEQVNPNNGLWAEVIQFLSL